MANDSQVRRRGLPRTPGGEPWPAAGAEVSVASTHSDPAEVTVPQNVGASTSAGASADAGAGAPAFGQNQTGLLEPDVAASSPSASSESAVSATAVGSTPLRRGLPRTVGGDPWPAQGFAPASASSALPEARAEVNADPVAEIEGEVAPSAMPAVELEQKTETPVLAEPEARIAVAAAPAAAPVAAPAGVQQAANEEPKQRHSRVKVGLLGGLGLIVVAGIIVLAARGVTTLPGVPEFLQRYPGEYAPAVVADPGFPAWARWTHYLNFFFLVLIVRTGLLVRYQEKPDAFYTPKRGGKKVSLYLWLHTGVDLLWLANGLIFVVLLAVTGHWARIVPTSWEVFPNAASAMLQYLTLDWPHEDAWVNYNSLQQLMYFVVVFIAAPLAAITGVRMSEWWPKDAERLNKAYPAPLARAIHFPTMLFFVFFVIIHVFLVFTTGVLKNLNHMFAGNSGEGWFGFWMFVVGLAVVVGVWIATRPLLIAPIANLFGKVTNR